MSDLLWKLEPATAAKHQLYKRYLDAWWPIMLQRTPGGHLRPRVTYVDAFAGPGRYEDGEEGSPVFVLDRLLNHAASARMLLARDRVRLVFIEKQRNRFEYLQQQLAERFGDLNRLPVHVEVRHGEAGVETDRSLNDLRAWGHPILAVFDSWGNVNIPLSLIHKLACNASSEVVVTFGPNWFSRREELNADQLDLVFGGRDYWTLADRESRPDERWRAWLSTYRAALGRAGFDYRLQFEVVPKTGQPLNLVYGTTHVKGVEVMKDAMWKVDGDGGMAFRDPRTRDAQIPGQLDIFGTGTSQDPELLELVMQRLAEGPATVDELRTWLLCETARWRPTHAQAAVTELRNRRQVVVEPPGRIAKSSRVRLP
ncbi:three-Cys-motif partner protein [Kibdelosporangium banguiense]|uniref:Three-Cys-motif partner protein n=1 Tax=Kibdelosporangium banguiense TaxID=1365924 RepID=A0ABS4U1U6_9PSEU|nr:three-Cys-motif partner protein TcmP [Kibdelosporangium banguiense]MBP2330606.1 three-Cys-motif partner protein [Kibdelosporangium banguiense]